ncbi:VOC family protein [Mesorhizobium opportunistum]|uniref:VOC family protein n=1 Tax=Mesorhizobium opportunistum TaxID=593909 RepID=A0ABV1YPF1_9HYPH|nr:VOC family protein [Mesorhizobium sp.]TIN96374.1 MAG: lactoylglutathione lyase [Mesorhizobium sp.]TJU98048.1 MAG: lactoylglutathione lyase [Mesorhizobium sp.]TJV14110.1 MAG: lactoylglutathione lyase [Mesorhizobium sp.]
MTKMIFLNLPVRNLQAATNFYLAIGGTLNPQFSSDQASSIMFSDSIGVMLLTHQHYSQFTARQIGDPKRDSQMLIALTTDSRDEVNAVVERGVAAGGRADPNPAQDLGFMFNRHIEDPDGNVWEFLWMNPAAMQ